MASNSLPSKVKPCLDLRDMQSEYLKNTPQVGAEHTEKMKEKTRKKMKNARAVANPIVPSQSLEDFTKNSNELEPT